MSGDACRACYSETLTPDQRERFFAEPITSCISLCPEHQEGMDRILSAIDWSKITVRRNSWTR